MVLAFYRTPLFKFITMRLNKCSMDMEIRETTGWINSLTLLECSRPGYKARIRRALDAWAAQLKSGAVGGIFLGDGAHSSHHWGGGGGGGSCARPLTVPGMQLHHRRSFQH